MAISQRKPKMSKPGKAEWSTVTNGLYDRFSFSDP